MKNSQTVIRSILGTADVDIRPLAYAVDAAVELMFRQGIPEDDIAVTKELYAKAAERLPKGKKGKRSVKTVTKQIQRVANACWDTLVREGMVEHHLGRPRKNHPCAQRDDFLSGLPGLLGNTVFPGDGGRENSAFFLLRRTENQPVPEEKKRRTEGGKDTPHPYNERTEESVTGNPPKFL